MTPLALIRLALLNAGAIGVGQTPSNEDNNDAFTHLNMMLSAWNRKRWLIWHLIDVSCVATGNTSYTVGTGGDFNTVRPDRIEAAFVRFLNSPPTNQPDSVIKVLDAREDYNEIGMKNILTGGAPVAAFYDSAYPTGFLYLWPTPSAGAYEIHLSIKDQLAQFSNLTDTINLPAEYQEALTYNLALRMKIMYGLAPDGNLQRLADASLNTIRQANTQIPRLTMPLGLTTQRGRYNIYSDQAG